MISWDKLKNWLYGAGPITQPIPGTGANVDTRSEEQKQGDIQFGELVASAAPVTWTLKASATWRKFQVFNQGTCDACVAFSMAKILGVMRLINESVFIAFCMGDIYGRRSNASVPGAASQGMNSTDPYIIAAEGVTLDAVVPSQNLTEAQMDDLVMPVYARQIGNLFKLSNPQAVILPIGNIDAVASVIQQTGKAVMVWYYFTAREWGTLNGVAGNYNVPQIADAVAAPTDGAALRHSVAAVDCTLMPDGTKALVIEDSAWFGNFNRRLVTESFHARRNFFAGYPMNFKTEKVSDAVTTRYTFTQPLVFISWNGTTGAPSAPLLNSVQMADVIALQTALQSLGYFPMNVKATGYYGALTAQAVLAWQLDTITTVSRTVLLGLAGQSFGTASIAAMNTELQG